MPAAPTTGKYKWLPTMCGAAVNGIKLDSLCGKRQFKTSSGPTCKDGHGGADGIDMTADQIVTWDKLYWDGEQPDDPDFEEPAGLAPGIVWADSWCSQTYRKKANDEWVKNRGGQQVCGLRQFTSNDGQAACARGHYAVGWPMSLADLELWARKAPDGVYREHFPKNAVSVYDLKPEIPCVGPGDVGVVVKLKSGGPAMTVEVAPKNAMERLCECIWFDAAGKLERSTFLIATLRLAKPPNLDED